MPHSFDDMSPFRPESYTHPDFRSNILIDALYQEYAHQALSTIQTRNVRVKIAGKLVKILTDNKIILQDNTGEIEIHSQTAVAQNIEIGQRLGISGILSKNEANDLIVHCATIQQLNMNNQ